MSKEQDFYEQWGSMKTEQRSQRDDIEEIKEILKDIQGKIDNQEKFIDKWIGGAFILMGIGAVLSWLVETVISYIK